MLTPSHREKQQQAFLFERTAGAHPVRVVVRQAVGDVAVPRLHPAPLVRVEALEAQVVAGGAVEAMLARLAVPPPV